MMNPRLSVDAMCSFGWSFDEDLALWHEAGVRHAGLLISKLTDDPHGKLDRLRAAGVGISTLIVGGFDLANPATWEANQATHRAAIDLTAAYGGGSIYFTSGRTVRCAWNEDFDLLAEAVGPTVSYARERGVVAALEPTTRTSVSFVTTLADAMDVAERTGLGIVADFANIWTERNIAETLKRGIAHLALVQIDDVVIGSSAKPAPGGRVHVGDGDLPLRRMIGDVLDAGYAGLFDLEVVPADYAAATDEAALRRGIQRASALLDEVGI